MTKLGVHPQRRRGTGDRAVSVVRAGLRPTTGPGRPRRYCRQGCRQQAHLARKLAAAHGLGDDDVVVSRDRLEDLQGGLRAAGCVLEDVERDLGSRRSPTTSPRPSPGCGRTPSPSATLWIEPRTVELEQLGRNAPAPAIALDPCGAVERGGKGPRNGQPAQLVTRASSSEATHHRGGRPGTDVRRSTGSNTPRSPRVSSAVRAAAVRYLHAFGDEAGAHGGVFRQEVHDVSPPRRRNGGPRPVRTTRRGALRHARRERCWRCPPVRRSR
ncbi:MAG: hypothetical protein U5R31_04375 [Acidimicrobiia bacterium]|nr:hypothetical protein [Acidimicrobiia bacterium]